ncbi:MAG: S41 family peptidase [Vicinamibacterales bacterium]
MSALVGGIFGRSALAVDDRVPKGYEAFTSALSAVEANYISETDHDRLVYGAIRGMLGTLDPHSSFFDPREYAAMRERQEGRYYGLGITIASIDGNITAQGVFEGSPASRQGVRRGDVIARINGEDAKGWTTEQAMKALRGQKGTEVKIDIRRRGYADPIQLTVVRDEVHILTVPAHFMLDATTGYIQMRDFGENTDREVKAALKELTAKGMKRLLFDIRNNPGGPLDQAIKVANEFLPKGKMIVYTRGRVSNSDQDYRSTEEGEFTDVPIVVLTNRASASAAEIVSGSLQDHDRAYLVGETTFGKALVQSVYRISGGAGLALTTAHYYTPSGRLIQRPWDASFDEYLSYSMKDQDAAKVHNPSDLKRTSSGRPVYSGGGVEPDRHMTGPIEGFNPTPFGRLLYSRQVFANYAQKFTAEGDTRIAQTASGRQLAKQNFDVDDAMIADFKEYLKAERYKLDEDAFAKDREFIRAMIRYDIDLALFGTAEARRRLLGSDPQAQLALGLFGEASRLSGVGGKAGGVPAN